MSMLKEAFAAGKFGVTAEMAPPKGYDFSEQLGQLDKLTMTRPDKGYEKVAYPRTINQRGKKA